MGNFEKLKKRGFYQYGFHLLLTTVINNFNGVLAKLDADSGTTDTNYNALLAITSPSIGTTYDKDVQPNGMYQGDYVSLLKQLRTNFNALLDKLAADIAVSGTTIFTNQKFASTANLVDVANARIKKRGEHTDQIVLMLDAYLPQFNTVLAALDVDAGVNNTNYAALYLIADVVDISSSSSSSSCRSSSSSSSSCRSSSSSSSSCKSSSSSCSSSKSSSSSSSNSSSSCSSSSSCRSSSSSSNSSSSSSSSCKSSSSSCSSSSSRSSSSSSCSSSSSSSSKSSSSSSSSSQAVT